MVATSSDTMPLVPHDDEFGYLLHNLATREDFSTYTEGEALALARQFGDDADWSLWEGPSRRQWRTDDGRCRPRTR
jgi:hypothetical protein